MGYEGVREVVGRKWTLELLELLTDDGPLNYSAIEDNLATSSDVVVDQLSLLESYGFLQREEMTPKDVTYEVTSDGERFLREIQRLQSEFSL